MSRASTDVRIIQPHAVSALSRKFRAETPYIVHFASDSDELEAGALAKLNLQADWIIDHPHAKFRVYGHTDKVGDLAYNAALGLRRAERVVGYLISRGISPDRLEAVASFGEEWPLIDTEAPERANRRALTDVIGFVAPVPGNDGGGDGAPGASLRVRTFVDPVPPATITLDASNAAAGALDVRGDTGGDTGGGRNPNAGRGNGDEAGDPGKSGGKNNGGDEVS